MEKIITFLMTILGRLPLPILHSLSSAIAWLGYFLSPALRRRVRDNLRQANLPNDGAMIRAVLSESLKGGTELAIAWTRTPEYMVSLFHHIEGWEYIEQAIANKKGLLLITPHLGSYDLAGRMLSEKLPFDLTAMFRPPKKAYLEPIMVKGRERGKGHAAPANAQGVRQVVRALKNREAVIILPDQVPKAGEGVVVPFFGRDAYTMTLASRLAIMKDVETLLFVGERLPKGQGFNLHIVPFSGSLNGEKEHDATLINRNVEDLIRRFPTQYLFSYKRYKMP